MEKHEENKITALLLELIERIDCNGSLISFLLATKTIGKADEDNLMALSRKMDRSKELLSILCTRKNGYQFLVEGLRKTNQTGALIVLNEPTHLESTQHEVDNAPLRRVAQTQISGANSSDSEMDLC